MLSGGERPGYWEPAGKKNPGTQEKRGKENSTNCVDMGKRKRAWTNVGGLDGGTETLWGAQGGTGVCMEKKTGRKEGTQGETRKNLWDGVKERKRGKE